MDPLTRNNPERLTIGQAVASEQAVTPLCGTIGDIPRIRENAIARFISNQHASHYGRRNGRFAFINLPSHSKKKRLRVAITLYGGVTGAVGALGVGALAGLAVIGVDCCPEPEEVEPDVDVTTSGVSERLLIRDSTGSDGVGGDTGTGPVTF